MKVKIKIPTKATYFKAEATTVDMFHAIHNWIRYAGAVVGCDIFRKDFTRKQPLFMFSILNLVFSIYLHCYDLYLFRDDLLRCCFLLVTMVVCGQMLIKLNTFIIYRSKIIELLDRAFKFLTNFNTERSNKIFEFWIVIICHMEWMAFIIFPLCCFVMFIYPVIVYIFTNEWILHFGFELPLLDWKNNSFAYLANWIYVGHVAISYASATIATVCLSAYFVFLSFGQFDILKMLLDELEDLVIQNKEGANDLAIKKCIKLITQQHYELMEFLNMYGGIFKMLYLVDISCLLFQNTVTLFAIVTMNFLPGYCVILVDIFQIFIPCLLGTFLLTHGENYEKNLCNLSWNLMSVADQRSLHLLLLGALNPKKVLMGLKVLNLQTFVEIYKAVYSYFMILLNMN